VRLALNPTTLPMHRVRHQLDGAKSSRHQSR
jgi:hypothetical protein